MIKTSELPPMQNNAAALGWLVNSIFKSLGMLDTPEDRKKVMAVLGYQVAKDNNAPFTLSVDDELFHHQDYGMENALRSEITRLPYREDENLNQFPPCKGRAAVLINDAIRENSIFSWPVKQLNSKWANDEAPYDVYLKVPGQLIIIHFTFNEGENAIDLSAGINITRYPNQEIMEADIKAVQANLLKGLRKETEKPLNEISALTISHPEFEDNTPQALWVKAMSVQSQMALISTFQSLMKGFPDAPKIIVSVRFTADDAVMGNGMLELVTQNKDGGHSSERIVYFRGFEPDINPFFDEIGFGDALYLKKYLTAYLFREVGLLGNLHGIYQNPLHAPEHEALKSDGKGFSL